MFVLSFVLLLSGQGLCLQDAPYSDAQLSVAMDMMLRNFTQEKDKGKKDHRNRTYLSGVIVASPSFMGYPAWFSGCHNYERVWLRDAAIAMSTLTDIYKTSKGQNPSLPAAPKLWGIEKFDAVPFFKSYITFAGETQKDIGVEGCDKADSQYAHAVFGVDGKQDPWGAQTDGPALRAISIMKILDVATPAELGLKDEELYTRYQPCANMGILKRDLCYVTKSPDKVAYDLWEEVPDVFFFNSLAQYEALIRGLKVAGKYEDGSFVEEMKFAKDNLAKSLAAKFWRTDKCQGYYAHWSKTDSCPNKRNRSVYNNENCINISTILPFTLTDDTPINIASENSLRNADAVRKAFCYTSCDNGDRKPQARYEIDDGSNGFCMYLGRYPGDVFDGGDDTTSNPWVLSTVSMAHFYYKLARVITEQCALSVTPDVLPFFSFILHVDSNRNPDKATFDALQKVAASSTHGVSDRTLLKKLAESLALEGDALIGAVKFYFPGPMDFDGKKTWLPEQINAKREAPQHHMRSAQDLTWSYAALLSAMLERKMLEHALETYPANCQ